MNVATIKKLIGPEAVFGMYLGDISEKAKINSPMPDRRDSDPSFAFRRVDGELLWMDFGRVGIRGGDCVKFVQEMFGLNCKKACDKIWNDFKGKKGEVKIVKKVKGGKQKGCKYGRLDDFELEMWKDFYLEREDLEFWNVFSNKGFWVNNSCLVYSNSYRPSYTYTYNNDEWIKGEDPYKVYTPNSKIKFFSHNIVDVVEGWDQLQGGGEDWELWMCSGLKDAMVVWKMAKLFGRKIDVIAPTTERSKTAILKRLPELMRRFPNRRSVMDFDGTGWQAMRDWKDYFKPCYIHRSNNKRIIKDVADVAKWQGIYKLNLILK